MFLNEVLLNPLPQLRPSARQVLNNKRLLKWCSASVELDKAHLKKRLIDEIDFANKLKIPKQGMNFDHLECVSWKEAVVEVNGGV